MRTMTKKLAIVFLLLAVVCGGLSMPKQASAKSVSKVSKTFTLTSKKSVKHTLSVDKKDNLYVKVKILEVKGSVSLEPGEDLWWGEYECAEGKGSFFYPDSIKEKSFKKGKVLTSKEEEDGFGVNGETDVEWYIPSGITKLKMKVTYYTKSGKANIKSIK